MNELPSLREGLEREGLWANKGLGQHFLLDMNITRRIAREAGAISGQPVIEIGPGPGGLTRALLEFGAAPLIAIEKDARFLPLLEPLIEWSGGRLRIVNADALEANEAALLADAPAHIVSNLPYNVGTPLLVKWLKAGAWRGPMTLMFQKEVAQRIVAKPGGEGYGRLAVLAQARCEAHMAFTIPARAFTPAPKIDSAVVRFTDRPDAYAHLDALEQVTAAAFGQRRKMLRSALKALTPDAAALLQAAGIDPTARAENLGQEQFRALADGWRALG
ncbi:MAG TPA: 16S rRNA (adenine(1518)-N(6)/adenine(1519)-N(6))-dimethyltransferase RsmA [Caulobacterales bacterium]|nr:16S rRNA (adenine(1518)-N(6)/adenine(1519)-N(6))-dimethyltransferase RsmA [Caulobacterales bacterium]